MYIWVTGARQLKLLSPSLDYGFWQHVGYVMFALQLNPTTVYPHSDGTLIFDIKVQLIQNHRPTWKHLIACYLWCSGYEFWLFLSDAFKQLLLGYLPASRDLWEKELTENRLKYAKLKEELLLSPVSCYLLHTFSHYYIAAEFTELLCTN